MISKIAEIISTKWGRSRVNRAQFFSSNTHQNIKLALRLLRLLSDSDKGKADLTTRATEPQPNNAKVAIKLIAIERK